MIEQPTPTEQLNSTGRISEEEVISINASLVPIYASVVDAQDRPVTDLRLEDFELLVNGKQRLATELFSAHSAISLALIFDNSSSAADARGLQKQAAINFIRHLLHAGDRATIYSVAAAPVRAVPLTSDVSRLMGTIANLPEPDGATALFDAIANAAGYLRGQPNRRIVVIVSDGVDTTSDLDMTQTLQRVQEAGCQVYAVQRIAGEQANLRDFVAERQLQEFAAKSSGKVYLSKSAEDLDNAFAAITADIAHQYVLSFYPTNEDRDGRYRSIKLSIPKRHDLRVRARRGYYARED